MFLLQTNFTCDFFSALVFSIFFLYERYSILVPFKHLYGPRYKHLKVKRFFSKKNTVYNWFLIAIYQYSLKGPRFVLVYSVLEIRLKGLKTVFAVLVCHTKIYQNNKKSINLIIKLNNSDCILYLLKEFPMFVE